MIDLKKPSIYIKVDADIGLYLFECEAATGKTRLYKELIKTDAVRSNIAAFSYNDYVRGFRLSEIVHEETKLVLIDRYDMFRSDEIDSLLNEYAKSRTVLVDLKRYDKAKLVVTGDAIIEMDKTSIVVYT